jgi:ABC-type lipoprotein release transport system permease subunit
MYLPMGSLKIGKSGNANLPIGVLNKSYFVSKIPLARLAIAVLLAAVALLASYIPARRAH